MQKTNIGIIISISLLTSLIFISSATPPYTLTYGDMWFNNTGTIVLNNSSCNVNIGENHTTSYKFNVKGTSNFLEDVTIHNKTSHEGRLWFYTSPFVNGIYVSKGSIHYITEIYNDYSPIIAISDNDTLFNYGVTVTNDIYGSDDLHITNDAYFNTITTSGLSSLKNITIADGKNINVGTSSGTKIASGNSQKIAFYGATPISQQVQTIDLKDLLINFGLYSSSTGATPLNLDNGALTCKNATVATVLIIPKKRTGDSLTVYSVSGSIVLNTTTNLIGSYTTSWKWR